MALWDLLSSKDSGDKRARELWDRSLKYFEGKLYNRALKDMQEAIVINPRFIEEAIELMRMFSAQGNDEQAVSVGLALLKVDSGNTDLMNRLGNSLRRMGSFEKSKRLYTHALKKSPQYKEARYNLAAASFRIKTADAALIGQTRKVEGFKKFRRYEFQGERADFHPVPNESIEEEPTTRDAEQEAEAEAEAEEKLSEEDLALMREAMIKDLQEDLEDDPESWEGWFNMGLLYDLFELGAKSISHYEQAIDLDSRGRFAVNNLAVAQMVHNQDPTTAEHTLLDGLRTHPHDRTMVLNLALIYRGTNKGFQQLKYFVYLGDLLTKSLGDFETDKMEARARRLYEQRKYTEAIRELENLSQEKSDSFWLEKLATIYQHQKREDDYIRTLRRLLKLDPQHPDAGRNLEELADKYESQAHEKIEKGSAYLAIQAFERAVKIIETPERWVELAQLYDEEGEDILRDNALKRWKELSEASEDATKKEEVEVE